MGLGHEGEGGGGDLVFGGVRVIKFLGLGFERSSSLS